MKIRHIIAKVLIILLAFSQTDCKKKDFDPSTKSRESFIGIWTGTLTTFKNNQLVKETGDFLIYPEEGGDHLGGIIYLSETMVFREFQYAGGTIYFRVENSGPSNSLCQNWTLSGYASFSDENTIDIRISGNECGYVGTEFVDWSGAIKPVSAQLDSMDCFTFAATSNNWTYRVEKKNGDTCQAQKLLSTVTGDYQFNGETTHDCGWTTTNIPVKWHVTPSEISILTDQTLCNLPVTIPVYARTGEVYTSVINGDSVKLKLIAPNEVITTPEGTFRCNQYQYRESYGLPTSRKIRTTTLWIDYHYGIIRQEVADPFGQTDIKSMILIDKNFLGN